jgi:siroheme synthase
VRSPAVIVIGEVVRLAAEGDVAADAVLRRAGEDAIAP